MDGGSRSRKLNNCLIGVGESNSAALPRVGHHHAAPSLNLSHLTLIILRRGVTASFERVSGEELRTILCHPSMESIHSMPGLRSMSRFSEVEASRGTHPTILDLFLIERWLAVFGRKCCR